jgi:hypothetical protein
MRIWVCTDFEGFWPVGTAAVVVAPTKESALQVLQGDLRARKLTGLQADGSEPTLVEIDPDSFQCTILLDGTY